MAAIQNNGTITITRGDLFVAPLFINAGFEDQPIRYDIRRHQKSLVQFSIMMPNQNFYDGVIRKVFTYKDANEFGDVMVTLKSKETKLLEVGKYFFQIKLVMDDGRINTITDKEILYVR